ncbi:hypothetical protein DJ94_5025 [Bacillus pseudomycoides]|nr:hypothetical protein DJ94_5025 [Bacillus pseudomycoides]
MLLSFNNSLAYKNVKMCVLSHIQENTSPSIIVMLPI